jgi:hypothetical protein
MFSFLPLLLVRLLMMMMLMGILHFVIAARAGGGCDFVSGDFHNAHLMSL